MLWKRGGNRGKVRAMADNPEMGAGGDGAQEQPGLEARVARLEQELAATRAEMAALRGERAAARPVAAAVVAPVVGPVASSAAAASSFVAAGRRFSAVPKFATAAGDADSLESQLGAKVLSKVAVVLLLVGAAWFLKWAFDNRWIGPAGRVMIGLVAGVGVVLWSEHFRRQKMAAFSYALKAVGSGVLYLSLWASFHLYHLVPAPVAFAAMVAVTLWNGVMAWSQDAQVLAGYALLGAYMTPVLLSTGGNHEIFLFSYLLLIAAALLALLRSKPWALLMLFALPVTAVFYIGWYAQYFDASHAWLTAGFGVAMWAVFVAVPLVVEAPGVMAGVLAPLGAAVFGELTVYSVLVDSGGKAWEPWVAVAFAAVYLAMARLRRAQAMVSAVHLAIAIMFLTIAIPLKATGHGITIGWLAEGVVLLWVATLESVDGTARGVLRWLGLGAMLMGVAGALIEASFGDSTRAFFNREFATSLAAIAALGAAIWLGRKREGQASHEGEVAHEGERLSREGIAAGALVLLNLVLVVAMHREIFLAASGKEYADFLFSAWLTVQGAAMLAAGFWKRAALPRWLGLILLLVTVVKVFVYDIRSLGIGYHALSYLALGVVLMGVSFAYQKDWLGLRGTHADEGKP
jgi:uncharacterized membrane protein